MKEGREEGRKAERRRQNVPIPFFQRALVN